MTEAADSYGTQHRRTVEEEARQLLADAEAKSKEQLDAAQAEADELEQTVVQRHETLQREAKMLEERKQRVLESLRDLAAQIHDALVEPARGEELVDVTVFASASQNATVPAASRSRRRSTHPTAEA
jgi:gas vesicle protein